MKLFKLIFILIFLVCAGGFAFLAVQEPEIEQKPIKKIISNDRFFE